MTSRAPDPFSRAWRCSRASKGVPRAGCRVALDVLVHRCDEQLTREGPARIVRWVLHDELYIQVRVDVSQALAEVACDS